LKNERKYVYRSTLSSEYGLTPSLIRKLGEPDEQRPNPHYRSGPPSSLYSIKRVEKFVAKHQVEIEAQKLKWGKRSDAAKKAAASKRNTLIRAAKEIPLKWKPLPKMYAQLESLANGHALERYGADAKDAGYNGVISTVRHEFTNYEEILAEFKGKVGTNEAYDEIRERLDTEIAATLRKVYVEQFG